MTETPHSTLRSAPFYAKWSLAPVWALVGAVALAGVWLQPNHYHPWAAFNSDAWMALIGLLSMSLLVGSAKGVEGLHGTVLGCFAFALVVAVQWAVGQIDSSGLAFVNIAYILGLALAMLYGTLSHGQPGRCERILDIFFLGVGVAGLVSVVIQFHQWLRLPVDFVWVVQGGNDRPYANLGQPNQLATLLVWNLLAVMWGVVRGKLGALVACVLAAAIAAGLALTKSRTGIVEIALVFAAAWAWRRLWPKPRVVAAMMVLVTLTYVVTLIVEPGLTQLATTGTFDGQIGGARAVFDAASSARLAAYELYLGAVWSRPWTGYGWNQLALAQLVMAEQFPATHSLFTQTHNLFLDIAVGMGLPIAIATAAGVAWWTIRSVLAVKRSEDAVLLLVVLSVGVHAMLELPLHYGYFLWPVGFFVGALNARLRHRIFAAGTAFKSAVLIWLFCAAAWGLVVRDYLLAEEEYRVTRFEALGIGKTPDGPRPQLWVLTQLEDLLWLARVTPRAMMPSADLDRMRHTVSMYPALSGVMKLAEALALNGQQEEAAMWLRRLQKIASPLHVSAGELHWMSRSASEPAVAAVAWPR